MENRRPKDSDTVFLELNEKWRVDIPFGWIPIIGDIQIPHTKIYKADAFELKLNELKSILKEQFNLDKLYEIEEGGTVKYLEIENCAFTYTGLEHLYSDVNYEIVIYYSHENSITIGGEKLIKHIHKIWPEHQQNIWKEPFG